jgi:hypothetical protein
MLKKQLDPDNIKFRLNSEISGIRQAAIREFCDWAIDTCILFGTTQATAYQVAATLAAGLEKQHDGTEVRPLR